VRIASNGRITRTKRLHEARRRDRPERDGAHRQAPDGTENAGEHLVGYEPLEQREDRDVLNAVRGADDGEEEDRSDEARPRGQQNKRRAPEDERETEHDGEAPALERHRSEPANEAADADRGRQVPDLGAAAVEHLEGGDHDQDVQTTANEGLRDDEPDE
jgi:hypothetical protein